MTCGRIGAVACGFMLLGLGSLAAQTAAPPPKAAPPAPAPAQAGSEPESTTASFGDWILRCERGAAQGRLCEVDQTLEMKGQGVVAQVALARLPGKDVMHVTVVLPNNVALTSGVRVLVSETDDSPLDLVWKRCLPVGCVAEADLPNALLKSWRTHAGAGQIRYLVGSGQVFALALSFRGLSVALDNLPNKQPAQ